MKISSLLVYLSKSLLCTSLGFSSLALANNTDAAIKTTLEAPKIQSQAATVATSVSVQAQPQPAIENTSLRLGEMEGKAFYFDALSLKEQMLLHKQARKLQDMKQRYAERYAFETLLAREANAQGLGREEYLRVFVFKDIPAVTHADVEKQLEADKDKYEERFLQDMSALKSRIREGILEARKDEKLQAVRKGLFAKYKVKLSVNDASTPEMKLNVPVSTEDAQIGDDKTGLQVVTFLDFECPYCKQMLPELLSAVEKTKAHLVFKHLPLGFHKKAYSLALASECAKQQGKFMEFVNIAYAGKIAPYGQIAKQAQLDAEKLEHCMRNDDAVKTKIQADLRYADKVGITGTPTTIIGGLPIVGVKKEAELIALIQERQHVLAEVKK